MEMNCTKGKRGDPGTKFTSSEFLRTIRPNRQQTGCPIKMVNNQCFGLLTLLNGDWKILFLTVLKLDRA